MHNAPSVSYPVGRPRFAALLAVLLWLAGAAATLAWLHEAGNPGWRQAFAAAALAVIGAWCVFAWLRSPQGLLHWDGASWAGPVGTGATALAVTLDLQRVLLVRWREPGAPHWLWLERSRSPEHWMDLRRAVYSRARPPALPPARPPVATP